MSAYKQLFLPLILSLFLSGCGLFEVYGKREYSMQHFKLVDEKTRKPITHAEVTVMATHGPQILTTINIARPKDVKGRTDESGNVVLNIASGPKIRHLAYGVKDGFIVLHLWDGNWEKDSETGTVVLSGNADSNWTMGGQ